MMSLLNTVFFDAGMMKQRRKRRALANLPRESLITLETFDMSLK